MQLSRSIPTSLLPTSSPISMECIGGNRGYLEKKLNPDVGILIFVLNFNDE